MPSMRVVLVELKYEGNVGAIARSMRNFDVEDLVLVNPPPIGAEARQRAMHGLSILESSRTAEDLDTALQGADLVIGTSGVDTRSEKRFARISVRPEELASRIEGMGGTAALLFGREDYGLYEKEILRCDLLVTIPSSPDYPILNVSHAATIVLYECFKARSPTRRARRASGIEKEKLHEALDALLEATEYPSYKRERTKVMFRRLLGRAVPSKWEFHALMGVLQRATKRIKRLEGARP